MVDFPLKLPRFTFFASSPAHGPTQELCNLIFARAFDVGVVSIQHRAETLFLPHTSDETILTPTTLTLDEFRQALIESAISKLGPGARAILVLAAREEIEDADHYIYLNSAVADAEVFATFYSPNDCLYLSYKLEPGPSGVRTVWFPTNSPTDNLRLLERELGVMK